MTERLDKVRAPPVALLVCRDLRDYRGQVHLYRLSASMEDTDYVVVSAAVVLPGTPYQSTETYIFAANPARSDHPVSWGELPGSYRGGLDHERALRDAGYEVRSLPEESLRAIEAAYILALPRGNFRSWAQIIEAEVERWSTSPSCSQSRSACSPVCPTGDPTF